MTARCHHGRPVMTRAGTAFPKPLSSSIILAPSAEREPRARRTDAGHPSEGRQGWPAVGCSAASRSVNGRKQDPCSGKIAGSPTCVKRASAFFQLFSSYLRDGVGERLLAEGAALRGEDAVVRQSRPHD